MTAQTRAVNKARFEQGDKPQGSDYEDLIDSVVMLAETTVQAMSGPLTVTTLTAAAVSAASVNTPALIVTVVSANSIDASAASFTRASAAVLVAASANITGNLNVTGSVTANSIVASAAAFTSMSAASLSFDAIVTAMVTASAVTGAGQTLPNVAKGFLTVQVCGATVAIPYFPVA